MRRRRARWAIGTVYAPKPSPHPRAGRRSAPRYSTEHTNTEIGPQSSTREQLRGITIAALIPRSRLDNFVGGERIDHAANAHEAIRTLLRSCHTPRLPQRLAPREQSSASAKEFAHGVSQRRRRLCALRWVAPRLLRRAILTALRVGAARVRSCPSLNTPIAQDSRNSALVALSSDR